jgi:hypothetical protein
MLVIFQATAADRGWGMNELVEHLIATTGLDRAQAERAIAIVLDFLLKEGPSDKVQVLIDKLPGAAEAVAAEQSAGGAGSMFGMGGVMGAGQRLMSAGLSMSEVQGVTREIVAYARGKVGEDVVGEIVGAIPGLSQFV